MAEWLPIDTAPFEVDVSVEAEDVHGTYVLTFPCRLTEEGWINSQTGARLAVKPTHWQVYTPRNSAPRTRPRMH
jgi:hypothetical protein